MSDKEFNLDAFQEDMLNVLKKHFDFMAAESVYAEIGNEPRWMAENDGMGGWIDCSFTAKWKVFITEKEAKKYGKGLR